MHQYPLSALIDKLIQVKNRKEFKARRGQVIHKSGQTWRVRSNKSPIVGYFESKNCSTMHQKANQTISTMAFIKLKHFINLAPQTAHLCRQLSLKRSNSRSPLPAYATN